MLKGPIKLSAHALRQMERRGITLADIEHLRKIGNVTPDPERAPEGTTFELEGPVRRHGRDVRVIFTTQGSTMFVITGMFVD